MPEYLRVTPTSEQIEPASLPRILDSLHKLTMPGSSGLGAKLNPLHSDTPPRFEFLVLGEGADEPVEFFYGADAHLNTIEKRLRLIYPSTFDVERVELDVASRLVQPIELTREEFVDHYEAGRLQYEFGPDERQDLVDDESDEFETAEPNPLADGGAVSASTPDHHVVTSDCVLELGPPDAIPTTDPLTTVDKPTMTTEGTILARPALDTVSPLGVRWCGSAARKQDWMTSLTPFTDGDTDGDLPSVDQPGEALASLVDHLIEATAPIAFQVVFQRRASWQSDAAVRKEDLADGRDTFFQELVGSVLAVDEQRSDPDERQPSESVAKRIEYIDAKNAKRSFTANIRAIGVPTDDTQDDLDARMDSLIPAFDPLDGPFYEVEGKRLRDSGFRETTKTKNARAALQRLLDREVTTGRGKTRPELVLSGPELANFVLVPSSEQLTVEGTRGTRAERQSRNPLPRPNPDLLQQFQNGMAVGYALDENGDSQPDPVRIPPDLLTTHYGRFASTGSGKSKAIINDALSLRDTTGGPVVIVDPKGDGMCENYLRCHYDRFGSLDDVYQFRVPEALPAFSFFDIRPALDAGRSREDAIQDKVDHFHDILRMIMGREKYDQAFVANEILSYLIKALFDAEYGSDAFGLDDLFEAALQMQHDQSIPPVSADNRNVEQSLTRHFVKDDRQFQVSMDAVGNRLDKLREDAHLRRIFSHVPEQNDAGEYVDNRFDFREFLDDDATVLFDLGDLRPEAQRAVTLLLLSNLWDAVQVRRRDGQADYDKLTNLIIEEAAPVASTKLVSEQLLPQGRSFGLSMGLVMQFPEQVRNRSERAYDEVLNNIKTKLIGNISIERALAESLAHEELSPTELRNRINTLPSGEWIAQLPSPSFGETGPAPFSLKPLPIAPGHPESDQPLSEPQEDHFETVARPQMVQRTQTQYALAETARASHSPDETGWGSSGSDTPVPSDADSDSDLTESSFIGRATAETTSTSDNDGDTAESAPGDNARDETSPFFGGLATDDETEDDETGPEDEASEDEKAPQDRPENGSSPVRESDVPVPDDELRNRGLSRDDVRFLSRVLDVMNREATEYTLLDSMRSLQDEFEDLDIQRLTDKDILEEATVCRRKYYTVLPAGRELLGKKLAVGPGKGDVGEKTPHKVGVRLLELWLQQQDEVTRVEPYYEHEEDTVFDVAGFDTDDNLVWVGEAELPSNNSQAPVDDYDKLSAVDADAIWAFNNRETAVEVLDRLADADRIEQSVSGRAARSFSSIRDAVEDFDAAGLTTVRSFKNLDTEVSS
ncbi:ATP-binding protein [Halomicrobium urmianum]|uniref:ATP-binding protein n=1 Tax=Halomicrobium urmianum TaxID=1586233 RepID=UPI001CD93C18|nr:ATP-binding protein [Halomicrobium urmianum]